MIKLIYDNSTLKGTCYIEVLPDKYKGECWNHSSIFFTEENFGYIMPAFEKSYKKFDYYAFNEIEVDTWELINKELETVKQYLANNPNPDTLKDVLGFPFNDTEKKLKKNYKSNLEQLISMIHEFQIWIETKSSSSKYITVLGM